MRYRTNNPFLSCMGGLCTYQALGVGQTQNVETTTPIIEARTPPPQLPPSKSEQDMVYAVYATDEKEFYEYDGTKDRYVEIETYEFQPNSNIWADLKDTTEENAPILVDQDEIEWKTDSESKVIVAGHKTAYIQTLAQLNPSTETKATGTTKKAATKPVPKPKAPLVKKSKMSPLVIGGIIVGLLALGVGIYYATRKKTTEKRKKNPKKGGRKPNSMTRYRISARKATKG